MKHTLSKEEGEEGCSNHCRTRSHAILSVFTMISQEERGRDMRERRGGEEGEGK